jgi:hypothetical protein
MILNRADSRYVLAMGIGEHAPVGGNQRQPQVGPRANPAHKRLGLVVGLRRPIVGKDDGQ